MVDDLAGASSLLAELLAFEVTREISIPGRLDAVVLRWGDVSVELMDVSQTRAGAAEGASVPRDHFAVEVEDLERAAEELAARGVRMTASSPSSNAVRSYFTDPATAHGLSIQLFERA